MSRTPMLRGFALPAALLSVGACANSIDTLRVSDCRPVAAIDEPYARKVAYLQQRMCEDGAFLGPISGVFDGATQTALAPVVGWFRDAVTVDDPPRQAQYIDERAMAAVETRRQCRLERARPPAAGADTPGTGSDPELALRTCVAERYAGVLATLRADPSFQAVKLGATPPLRPVATAVEPAPPAANVEPKRTRRQAPAATTQHAAAKTVTASRSLAIASAPPAPPRAVGEAALALETVECKANNEVWITYYAGTVTKIEGEAVQIRLDRRYGLWYDFNGQGIDDKNWFCAPDKRLCYSEIDWSGWGGRRRAGEVVIAPKDRAFAGGDPKLSHPALGEFGARTRCP